MDWIAIAAAVFVVASAMPMVRWLSRSRIESSALSQAWLAEHQEPER